MPRVALGLGSNLGERGAHLERALEALVALEGIVSVSPFVETEPVGGPPQGRYLNAAVVLETTRTPQELLSDCRAIERAEGRTRDVPLGPRTLDIDLLLYGDEVVDEPDLQIPHPRLSSRSFVLAPLAQVAPDWTVPGLGRSVEELLADLPVGS